MERNRRPAWSRGGPATGAGTAEHPRLSETYVPHLVAVNAATGGTHGGGGDGTFDALVTLALARFSAVLWTLRGVGAVHQEQRLRDGVRDILAAAGDAGGGGDDAA